MSESFDDGEIVAEGIIQADALQQYVDTLNSLVQECKVHFGDHGLTGTAVDPANVAMFDAELSKHGFESYDSPGQVVVGVNIQKLDDYLGSANSDDLVHLGVDMESRHLRIRYRAIEHEMALIDPDSVRNEPDIPDLDLPNYAEIQSDDLAEARKNIELVTDHLWIQGDVVAGEGEIRFVGKGDTDRTVLTYTGDDLARDEVNTEAESCFSIDYIKDMEQPIPSGVDVGIEFGDEFPMVWTYRAFDEALDVTYSLAPRIQSD